MYKPSLKLTQISLRAACSEPTLSASLTLEKYSMGMYFSRYMYHECKMFRSTNQIHVPWTLHDMSNYFIHMVQKQSILEKIAFSHFI